MLAIARALAAEPKALQLDEPSMGLAPKLVDAILAPRNAHAGRRLCSSSKTRAGPLALADYAYVMERGTIGLQGRGDELLGREEITAAHLGEGTDRRRLG